MKTCISIEEWIDVWGTIVGNAKRMDDFPMWLQYYPKVLFDIINRSGTNYYFKSNLLLKYLPTLIMFIVQDMYILITYLATYIVKYTRHMSNKKQWEMFQTR